MNRLERLRELEQKTTPGPWQFKGQGLYKMLVGGAAGTLVRGVTAPIIVADPCVFNPQDEPIVAVGRTELPLLLAVAEAAERAFRNNDGRASMDLWNALAPLLEEVTE